MIRKVVTSCALALFLSGAVAIAHADTVGTVATFTLTNAGTLNSVSGPFGTITLTQTAAGVVTVKETLAPNEYYAGTGAGDSLGFNIKPAAGTLFYSGLTSGFHVGVADALNPFGSFLETIACDDPAACHGGQTTNTAGPLMFTVTSALGVNVSDFIANSGGFYFASDIFIGNTVTGVGQTGNVGGGGGTTTVVTPEPSSLMLLGTGILGAAGLFRRRFAAAVNRS